MARAYTVATAALALHVTSKWLDNTLSHYPVQGVSQAKQGVARRLPIESLNILGIALTLIQDLSLPTAKALELATTLLRTDGRTILSRGTQVQVDIQEIKSALLDRLEHAVEIAPLPRRGRPPQNTTGRLD